VLRSINNLQKAFLQFIRAKLGDESFAMWFEGQFQLLCGNTADALYISAEAPFVLDWYRRNFQGLFAEAVHALFPTFTGTVHYITREEVEAMNGELPAVISPVLQAVQELPQVKTGALTQIRASRAIIKAEKPEKEFTLEPISIPLTRSEILADRRQKSRETLQAAELVNIPEMTAFLRGMELNSEPKSAVESRPVSVSVSPKAFEPVSASVSLPIPPKNSDPMADFVSLMDQMAAEGKIQKSLFQQQVSIPEPVVEAVLSEPAKAEKKPVKVKTKAAVKFTTGVQTEVKPASETKPASEPVAGNKLQALMANVMKLSEADETDGPAQAFVPPPRGTQPTAVFSSAPSEGPVTRSVGYSAGTFESFVCGSSNRVAYTTALSLNRNLGLVSPILFTGPTGVGKTHLLDATYRKALTSGFTAVYKTCEEFMNDFVSSLRDPRRKTEFQATYRQCDVLLLDNLQFMLDKKGTISELQNIFNYRMRHGKQIVLASDRELKELEGLGAEINSLLRGGCECRLNEPSYDVRLGILSQGSKQRSLPLTPEQQHKIASQCTSDVRELLGKLNTLEMMARAQFSLQERTTQTQVSAQERTCVVQQLVESLVNQPGKMVSLDEIKRYVAVQFGIDVQLLASGKRTRNVSQPRMLAMWLARKFTRKPLMEISRAFGCSSHTTVVSAQKKVEEWRTTDFRIQTVESVQSVNELLFKLENQIQRV